MGLFSFFKKNSVQEESDKFENEFGNISNAIFNQINENGRVLDRNNLAALPAWNEIKSWTDKKKVDFIVWLAASAHEYIKKQNKGNTQSNDNLFYMLHLDMLPHLVRGKLALDADDAVEILTAFSQYRRNNNSYFREWPLDHLLSRLEKNPVHITDALKTALKKLEQELNTVQIYGFEKERLLLIRQIDTILLSGQKHPDAIAPTRFYGADPFSAIANEAISNMPEAQKIFWYKFLPLAQTANVARPSDRYLKNALTLIEEAGRDNFIQPVHAWMQQLIKMEDTEVHHAPGYSSHEYLSAVNHDAIKGIVWACVHFNDSNTVQLVAALADRAYQKIPQKGPAAPALGNACLYALFKIKSLDGIAQLSRLKMRIKQSSAQSIIEKYLKTAAGEQNVSVAEMEDMAVPDFGLTNGIRIYEVDGYKCELVVAGIGKTEMRWFKPDGIPQKSVPATIKDNHADTLKEIKNTAKQIEQTLVAQRDRTDRMFRNNRNITPEKFEQYYLSHGLMQLIARDLIWNFHQPDKIITAIQRNNQWVNQLNEIVDVTGTETITLWHPVQASVESIKTWREFLMQQQLQQPLKQAYREIYLLTDAEINTQTYSNRMAAHILRQHQFNVLAKSRGWKYSLMGAFDNGGREIASLHLPEESMVAQYWINEVNTDGATNPTGMWNYISTDQVRFIDANTKNTIQLLDIPAMVFSEVMRDVDLFVGVASVGNDPTWADTGGLATYRDYWTKYSFGDLSELAKNRKELLENLVPRLKIRDVASIKDKFLVVQGKLRTYKIHLGSTNILMEPNDQYLCIVVDRNQKNVTENVFLPFEGDTGLSIILSKAFLLADDDKIKDKTITRQIERK